MEIKRKTVRRMIGGAAAAGGGGVNAVTVGNNEYSAEDGKIALPQYVEGVSDGININYPDSNGHVAMPMIPRSVSVNGSTYTPDAAGDVDLGNIGGGTGAVDTVEFNKLAFAPDANGNVNIGHAFTHITYNNYSYPAVNSASSGQSMITLPCAPMTESIGTINNRWVVVYGTSVQHDTSMVTINVTGSTTVQPSVLVCYVSLTMAVVTKMTTLVVPMGGYGSLRVWAVHETGGRNVLIIDKGGAGTLTINTTSLRGSIQWLYYDKLAGSGATPDVITVDAHMYRTAAMLQWLATNADTYDYRYARLVSLDGGNALTPVSNIQVTATQHLNDIV